MHPCFCIKGIRVHVIYKAVLLEETSEKGRAETSPQFVGM